MKNKRQKRQVRTVWKLLGVAAALAVIGAVLLSYMRPVILSYAQTVAKRMLLSAANEAVVNVLRDTNTNYDDLVRLSTDADNRITGLQIDALAINLLKSQISLEIERIAAEEDTFYTYIPVGSFLGSEYTAGRGPKIRFSMQLTSNSTVEFQSEFKDAGLNQVVHRIYLYITVTGRLVLAGAKDTFSVETSALLAETVIVGLTPDAFTEVNEGVNGETADLISNYGAEAEK
ncbi:MAG: sporulation protein YunB [Candidatus Fimenecus sp.]